MIFLYRHWRKKLGDCGNEEGPIEVQTKIKKCPSLKPTGK